MSVAEYPTIWEEVSENNNHAILRLKVPGGWMVSVRYVPNNDVSITYISDPDHSWVLSSTE